MENGNMIKLANTSLYVAIASEDSDACENRINMDAVEIAKIATGAKTYSFPGILIFFICKQPQNKGLINIQIKKIN